MNEKQVQTQTAVEDPIIELRCSKDSYGKINARTFLAGKELKEKPFSVIRGDQFSLVLLFQEIKKQYPTSMVQIKGLDKYATDYILNSKL